MKDDINKNFDANYKGDKLDVYNIILTSDVLAEGVNLHRSNIIVNYDSPWNATRLMQRIGRVNRIGSVADNIYNYMFYPSEEGNDQIGLYQNALLKLQGFHTALGEDAQIYTRQEILHDFKLFDENVRDNIDKQLEMLREVRNLYADEPELYKKIKELPIKSRTVRKEENRKQGVEPKTSIVYISKGLKSQFYKVVGDGTPEKLEFVEAAEILRADRSELTGNFDAVKDIHYKHVEKAFNSYIQDDEKDNAAPTLTARRNDNGTKALALIRQLKRAYRNDEVYDKILIIETYVQTGVFTGLTKAINRLTQQVNKMTKDGSKMTDHSTEIIPIIDNLYSKYYIPESRQKKDEDFGDPMIVTSETFE